MNRDTVRSQLQIIAATFALIGPARVELPSSKYEALRSLAESVDDFTTKLECVEGQYIERITVTIVVDGVSFVATKVQPTAMREAG